MDNKNTLESFSSPSNGIPPPIYNQLLPIVQSGYSPSQIKQWYATVQQDWIRRTGLKDTDAGYREITPVSDSSSVIGDQSNGVLVQPNLNPYGDFSEPDGSHQVETMPQGSFWPALESSFTHESPSSYPSEAEQDEQMLEQGSPLRHRRGPQQRMSQASQSFSPQQVRQSSMRSVSSGMAPVQSTLQMTPASSQSPAWNTSFPTMLAQPYGPNFPTPPPGDDLANSWYHPKDGMDHTNASPNFQSSMTSAPIPMMMPYEMSSANPAAYGAGTPNSSNLSISTPSPQPLQRYPIPFLPVSVSRRRRKSQGVKKATASGSSSSAQQQRKGSK